MNHSQSVSLAGSTAVVLLALAVTTFWGAPTVRAQHHTDESVPSRPRTVAPTNTSDSLVDALKGISRKRISNTKAPAVPPPRAKERWLPDVKSRAEFDAIARVFFPEMLHPLPHVLFVIDLKDKNKIYYVNMKFYDLHEVFVNSMYLTLERGRVFWENNHLKPNRRFICGRVAYQSEARRFAFEFWEGDTISTEQLALTAKVINRTFFTSVAFKANSPLQEANSAAIPGLARILPGELGKKTQYQALNIARAVGRVRLIGKELENSSLHPEDIVVLDEAPISLPPVAGLVMSRMASPLSHVNLLARSWGVPNAFIDNARQKLEQYNNQIVSFETRPDSYHIKPATGAELELYRQQQIARRRSLRPRATLTVKRLLPLRDQNRHLVQVYGAKSTNLGEIISQQIPSVSVPDGFTIPFYYYDQFIRENRIVENITAMLDDERFLIDVAYRRERLAQLRRLIQSGILDSRLRSEVVDLVRTRFGSKGVFVRSSSNSEDLPNFSGAGLYSTVPNVRGEEALVEAIKTVWASVWNFEAYETRERAGVDHTGVMMAVIVQEGINADSAGVMITTDPFNSENKGGVYINAKRGLGIRVVEGKRVAEQLIYEPQTDSIHVLTRSAEDSLLTFDERGGIRELPLTGTRVVLTDEIVRRLSEVAQNIKRVFGEYEQDIEWAIVGNEIYILQSRPYLAPPAGS